jgi:23S rRNA pseudouridine1911/1915/1917 synthase
MHSGVQILYEDNHLISVFKPANVLIQGDQTGDISLLELTRSWIKNTYAKPGNVYLGLLHRLDRPVSGVVLFAKTSKAASRLSEQFRERKIEKKYWALVDRGNLSGKGELRHFLAWENNRTVAYDDEARGRDFSSLNYLVLEESRRHLLVEIDLHTGRKHQIRSQLAKMGSFVVGDVRYGSPSRFSEAGIALMAKRLCFYHPVRSAEQVVVQCAEKLSLDMIRT